MRYHINNALRILNKVFGEGTYANLALSGEEKLSDMSAKLVYGVLDENVKLEYILDSMLQKKPKPLVYVLLKIGTYALLNLDDVPDYAIVSECVEVAKMNGKGGAGGFVNAVLKKAAAKSFKLPEDGEKNYLSVHFSKPQWFVDKLTEQYGEKMTRAILGENISHLEHIRANKNMASVVQVKSFLDKGGTHYTESKAGGLTVKSDETVRKLFNRGQITFQSPSSMLAVQALNAVNGSLILDLCSAPGGKAVYIAEKCPDSIVLACDVYQHRIGLIKDYCRRMRTQNVEPVLYDATIFNPDWQNKFDFVLVDAPCSCFGTYPKHPDVFLSKENKDIAALVKIQRSIVSNAVRYVKDGGVLVYSTCTLFKEENSQTTEYILKNYSFRLDKMDIPYSNDGTLQIFPHGEWDGFYIARFKKYKAV
jgi:16S rRNA (cytosine967-C5)-methyltransferase